jgi:hypothetical protein
MTDAEPETELIDIIAFASEMLGFPVPAMCGDGILENLRLLAAHRQTLDSYLSSCTDEARS